MNILKILFFIFHISIYDLITLIVAIASLLTSIVVIVVEYRHNKEDEETKKTEMKAKYYSYLLPSKIQSITIFPDRMTSINACIVFENILKEKDKKISEDLAKMLEFCFSFENYSQIYPLNVLVKNMTLSYSHECINDELNVLNEQINFESVNQQFKNVYINEEKQVVFTVKCIIDEQIEEKLNSTLSKDRIIEIDFDLVFDTLFNVKTFAQYKIKLKLKDTQEVKYESFIGLNEKNFRYEIEMMQYQNEKIEYIEK